MKKEEVVIRKPTATRPWQHVLEPLRGYLWLAASLSKSKIRDGEAMNFGPSAGANKDVSALVKELSGHLTGLRMKKVEKETKEYESELLALDSTKAYRLIQWEPILSFEGSIKMVSDWYQAVASGEDEISAYEKNINEYVAKSKVKGARCFP